MSVRANERSASQMEFINSAHELEIFTIKLALRENVIPKRYRYVLAKPLCESARLINQYITMANELIPKDSKEYKIRHAYQRRALAEMRNYFELMRIASEILSIKRSTLEEWTKIANKESKAMRGWIQSDSKRYESLTF